MHLQDYFEKSRRAVSGIDQGLCLLCVQCFEVCTAVHLTKVIVIKDPFIISWSKRRDDD